jgi:hypothetical protein
LNLWYQFVFAIILAFVQLFNKKKGIRDWGLAIGDPGALLPIPNPQSLR